MFGNTNWSPPVPGPVLGTATNDNATAGNVGQVISASRAFSSPVSLVSGTAADVTTISLTPGDWEVTGQVDYAADASTIIPYFMQGSNTVSASLGAQDTYSVQPLNAAVATDPAFAIPARRISIAATTTLYLVAKASFSVSTLAAYGTLRARRVR